MNEVWALADRMTIFRDGRTVGQHRVDEIDQRTAVNLMAGRDVRAIYPQKRQRAAAEPVLELRNVQLRRGQRPWSLSLNRGEILGLGGLQGQGQRHFLHWLYGDGAGRGEVLRTGRRVQIRRPGDALRNGIVLIPEDRGVEGLHSSLPVRWNLAMATLRAARRLGVIDMRAERRMAADRVERDGDQARLARSSRPRR